METIEGLLADTVYRPIRRLGKGRTGEVYLVEHTFLGRQFALKVLRAHLAADGQYADRMRVEAQAAGRLQHPNIVEMVDFWVSTSSYPCVVMELLQGNSLATELATQEKLEPWQAVEFAKQALSGLSAAHALGVVHRDVTPDNLFIQKLTGFSPAIKILDFGLARVLPTASLQAPDPLALPTKTGVLVGSPRFMSPEAARGERVDQRADIFSLGVVLYAMLTGRGPYDRAAPADPPSKFCGAWGGVELDAIVLRAIDDDIDRRYQTAAAFLSDLAKLKRLSRPPARDN